MLYELYCAVPAYLEKPTDQRRVQKIIDNYIERGWTKKIFNKPRNYNVRYLYDHRIDIRTMNMITRSIVTKSKLEKYTEEMILQKIRIIPKNRKSIKQILVNNKRKIEEWSDTKEPICIGRK